MAKLTTVTSAHNGVTYNVRLVEKGDRYGRNMCLVHDEDRPMVVFYDTKSPIDYDFVGSPEEAKAAGAVCLGQQASSYYVETLLENIATTGGIDLCGHVPRWKIDGNAVREAFQNLGLWSPPEASEGLPFFARAFAAGAVGLSEDIKAFFSRMLGPMHALQAAYPGIDVSHLIKSFEVHAGVQKGFRPETIDGYVGPAVVPAKLVVVYDSQDPDTEPAVWVPLRVAPYWTAMPLNKSQELGGRFPNTDPADIELLEAGCNAAYPDYVKLP